MMTTTDMRFSFGCIRMVREWRSTFVRRIPGLPENEPITHFVRELTYHAAISVS